MAKAGQFSLRALFIAVTIVALLIGGALRFAQMICDADGDARRQAIRKGLIDPQEYEGWFSPEEFQELKREYQRHKDDEDRINLTAKGEDAGPSNANSTVPGKVEGVANAVTGIMSPVTATLQPSKTIVHPGETFEIAVTIQIAPSWHIYAVNRPAGISAPTVVSLELPACVEQAGEWKYPDPLLDAAETERPTFIYTDQTIFRRPVRVSSTAGSGKLKMGGKLQYQACDPFSCRPPETIELQTEVQVEP
jgi:hypothetical protein